MRVPVKVPAFALYNMNNKKGTHASTFFIVCITYF